MSKDEEDSSRASAGGTGTTALSRRSLVYGFAILGLAATGSPIRAFATEESNHDSANGEPSATNRSLNEDTQSQETFYMPLVKIDAIEGRSHAEVKVLLDATHRAIVSSFGVPIRDRYQVYQAHPKAHLIIEDTGLGIPRTDNALIFTIFSKKRDEPLKVKLYKELTRELQDASSIAPSDVVISIIENTGADWSFGNGVAQFLTGDLK